MHAPVPLTADLSGGVTIKNLEQSVCITPLIWDGMGFKKRIGPSNNAGSSEGYAYFSTQAAKKTAEFLVLLDIGCNRPKVTKKALSSGQENLGGQCVGQHVFLVIRDVRYYGSALATAEYHGGKKIGHRAEGFIAK